MKTDGGGHHSLPLRLPHPSHRPYIRQQHTQRTFPVVYEGTVPAMMVGVVVVVVVVVGGGRVVGGSR